jgi:hypothetical protein
MSRLNRAVFVTFLAYKTCYPSCDWVVTQALRVKFALVLATFAATNLAPFQGMPAMKEEVTTAPVFFFKFGPDGKIVEHWQESLL